LANQPCSILIATPGRLLDHLRNFSLKPKLSGLQTFVLDEVDRLLDQGFKKELDSIVSFLPDTAVVPRQSLFFSATIDNEVKKVGRTVIWSHSLIDTCPF
jgi:ATP-dependent RNA helicase MSS116